MARDDDDDDDDDDDEWPNKRDLTNHDIRMMRYDGNIHKQNSSSVLGTILYHWKVQFECYEQMELLPF